MGRVVSIADPSNASIQHPIALEDNAVSLSGWCSDEGSIRNNSLVALVDGYGMIQALYEGYSFTTEPFPIGCNIYCYIGNNNISDCNIINNIVVDSGDLFGTKLNFYSSYYDLSLNVNGGDYDNYFANGDNVFLKVNIDATGTKWTPVALVGSSHLIEKYFYIRLGAYTGDTSSQSQSMADKFMLEDNNPLYYYDGTNLIEYSVWLAKQKQAPISAGVGISISGTTISSKIPYYVFSLSSHTGSANDGFSGGDFVNVPDGFYKVTVHRHLYGTNTRSTVFHMCLRYKHDASSSAWHTITAMSGNIPPAVQTQDEIDPLGAIAVTMIGFVDLRPNRSNYALTLYHEVAGNVVIGETVPNGGDHFETVENDFILFERLREYIPT